MEAKILKKILADQVQHYIKGILYHDHIDLSQEYKVNLTTKKVNIISPYSQTNKKHPYNHLPVSKYHCQHSTYIPDLYLSPLYH